MSRLQGDHAMLGVPVPDATQWDQIEQVGDCAYVVCEPRETVAAQGERMYQDETAVRRRSLLKEHLQILADAAAQGVSRPTERTGMQTTAWVVHVGEQTIVRYSCGRCHAGENLTALLEKRETGLGQPLVRSDALSSKAAKAAAVIRWHCLAHGRRKCSDREDVFPQACQVVLEVSKQVFAHDKQARDEPLSPAARLAYHQASSRPIMDGLHRWLAPQLAAHLVAPHRSLGKAMASLQDHGETRTRFFCVPGAPLDNNLVERALTLCMRHRTHSLLSATESRASSASVLTSLMATCLHAGVNALESLGALQEHRAAVCAEPAAWLPWNDHAHRVPP